MSKDALNASFFTNSFDFFDYRTPVDILQVLLLACIMRVIPDEKTNYYSHLNCFVFANRNSLGYSFWQRLFIKS